MEPRKSEKSSIATTSRAPRLRASNDQYPSHAPTSSTRLPVRSFGTWYAAGLIGAQPGVTTPPGSSMRWYQYGNDLTRSSSVMDASRSRSREQPLQPARLGDAADRDRVGGGAVVAVGFVGLGVHGVERPFHHALQLVLYALHVPEERVETLHPLEVADRH